METPERLNKALGQKMLDNLTAQNAEIVFMFGIDKAGKAKVAVAHELPKDKLKEHLRAIIRVLERHG